MANTPTPHNKALMGQIAQTVLLPGDPRRAKLIAEQLLTDVKLVSDVRNNYCYTGLYNGKPVSVMSTGMGCASMGIYSYELFKFYGVKNAIRVGTIGSLNTDYKIGDIVIAQSTITNTNYMDYFAQNGEGEVFCSKKLLDKLNKVVKNQNRTAKLGKIYTTDTFYSTKEQQAHQISLNAVGVEMECASLYLTANSLNKNAICICTVSDEVLTGEKQSSEERENNFLGMATLALDLAYSL